MSQGRGEEDPSPCNLILGLSFFKHPHRRLAQTRSWRAPGPCTCAGSPSRLCPTLLRLRASVCFLCSLHRTCALCWVSRVLMLLVELVLLDVAFPLTSLTVFLLLQRCHVRFLKVVLPLPSLPLGLPQKCLPQFSWLLNLSL